MITITVNGRTQNFSRKITVDEVLQKLQIHRDQGIAVAHNYHVLSKKKLNSTFIEDGDQLEIIQATAGG